MDVSCSNINTAWRLHTMMLKLSHAFRRQGRKVFASVRNLDNLGDLPREIECVVTG